MKESVAPAKPMTRQAARRALEAAREDIAKLMAQKVEEQQYLHRLLAITDEIWQGTQPDDAPEIELSTRIVRAS